MVELNNSYKNLNKPLIDSYIRNLSDYRSSIENTILPIISYFLINHNEFNISVQIMNDQEPYMKRLIERYYIEPLEFLDGNEENIFYDLLAKLMRHTRKSVQYSHCDLLDFMIEYPKIFDKVKLPENLLRTLYFETKEYGHKIPKVFKKMIDDDKINFLGNESKPISNNLYSSKFMKYSNSSQLYAMVLSNVKKAIDLEILKFYDFLLDYDVKKIRSNKILELKDEIIAISKEEYTKLNIITKFESINRSNFSEIDIWFDEWGANLRRALECKEMIAKDLIETLTKFSQNEKLDKYNFYENYLRGSYPELAALIHHFYSGDVPDFLKIN